MYHRNCKQYLTVRSLKGFSYGTIATAIYFLQLMDCLGYSFIVTIAQCEHLHQISRNSLVAIKIAVAIALCEQPLKVEEWALNMNLSDTRLWSVVVVKYVFHICSTWHFSCFMANMVVLYALTCYKLYAMPQIECKLFCFQKFHSFMFNNWFCDVNFKIPCGILVEESVLTIVNLRDMLKTYMILHLLFSTLQMLTNIENRLEELFEMIEMMPQDKVEAAEKVK